MLQVSLVEEIQHLLPEAGAYFAALTEEMEEYVEKFCHDFLTSGIFTELKKDYMPKDENIACNVSLLSFWGMEQYFSGKYLSIGEYSIKADPIKKETSKDIARYNDTMLEIQSTECLSITGVNNTSAIWENKSDRIILFAA